MTTFYPLLLSVHILIGLGLIGLVLLQHGKGADMGAAFGSGASGSLFGATGSASFLSRTTAILAAVFFMSSLGLTYILTATPRNTGSVVDSAAVQPADAANPANPANPAAPPPAAPAPVDNSKTQNIPR